MNEPESPEEELAEGTLVSHLVELRQRLLKAVFVVLAVFLALVPFAQQVFIFLSHPVRERLPEGTTLIAVEVASPFLVPFKATFYAAVFIAMPFILYQAWRFVEPALYRSERRFAVPLVFSSILLFYAGVAFAYLLVIKLAFGFFISATPEGVTNAPDIGRYLSFVLNLFLAFGVAFQVPIATFVLAWSGLAQLETLRAVRSYVFLGAFVVGMLLTPSDPLSQTFLAIPIYLLYECGLLLSRFLLPERFEKAVAK
jgi:sec-independent protein translocase protein TatC